MAEEAEMLMFPVKAPRFSTIILDDPARAGKLMIAEGFAAEHGAKLPNKVSLKLPNGSGWEVRVIRSGRKIWFYSGWQEFARFNSLIPGYFLVFHYDSCGGHFLVFIFDATGTEIGYKTKEASRAVKLECGLVDDSDVPLNDQLFPSPKTREKPPLASPQPHKLRRNGKGKSVRNSDTMFCCGSSSSMAKQGEPAIDNPARKRKLEKKTPSLTDVEKAKLLARASAGFKSKNPYFMLAMQPSYVGTHAKISLPPLFFERNFEEKCGVVILQVLDGRVWRVEYRVKEFGTREKVMFTANSWTPFVRENSLEVGDVCAFELVKGGADPILKVAIFRATPQDLTNRCPSPNVVRNKTNETKPRKSSPSQGKTVVHGSTRSLQTYDCCPARTSGNASKRLKQLNNGVQLLSVGSSEAAKSFSSDRPFFKVSVEASHLSMGQMSIPMAFSIHIKEVYDEAELRVADKCWAARIRKLVTKTGRHRNYLGSGWGAFATGNSLEVGDVCVYEVMKGEADDSSRRTMVLSVHIFRATTQDLTNRCPSPNAVVNETHETKPKKSSSSRGKPVVHGSTRSLQTYGCCPASNSGNASKPSNNGVQLLSVESSGIPEAAKSFSSDRPFFKVSIEASHRSSGQMTIPKAFRDHMKEVYNKAELWVAAKSWGVRIGKKIESTDRHRIYLGCGWRAFATENSLDVGDVCVFEVMKGEADDDSRRTMVLCVHIFRG